MALSQIRTSLNTETLKNVQTLHAWFLPIKRAYVMPISEFAFGVFGRYHSYTFQVTVFKQMLSLIIS